MLLFTIDCHPFSLLRSSPNPFRDSLLSSQLRRDAFEDGLRSAGPQPCASFFLDGKRWGTSGTPWIDTVDETIGTEMVILF